MKTAIAAPITVIARCTGCRAESIDGGRIAGEQVRVEQSTLFQDRDYPVLNEYRAVFAGLFRRLWSLNPQQLERVFPQVTPVDLKLV